MLPEPPNKSHLFLTYFELDSDKKPHSKLIHSHPFNHEIQILLADVQVEALFKSITDNDQFFYEVEAPLSIFLDKSFLEQNVTKKGSPDQNNSAFYMHTVDTYLDTEDVAIVDGDGHLVLSLQKETYEAFGLEGKAAKFSGNGRRYIVTIDLSVPTFRPGNKSYDRAKWCLENNLSRSFKMVMTRVDINTGASLDIPFSKTQHNKKSLLWTSSKIDGIRIPTFESLKLPNGTTPDNRWKDEALEAHEWLGLASLGAQRLSVNDKPDPFLSVYSCPEPYTAGSITILRSTGLATPQYIEHLLVTLRKEIKLKLCWSALTAWGYRDSPIAWRGREHGFLTNGENDYTILLLKEKKDTSEQHAVCYQALGVYDTFEWLSFPCQSKLFVQHSVQQGMESELEQYKLQCIPNSAYYIPNFISASEEEHLISKVQTAPAPKWVSLKARRLQNWGGTPKVEHGKMIQEPIPTWLKDPIFRKLQSIGVNFGDVESIPVEPNHILVNEYLPGQGIMPHQDGPLYNPIVATVTLNSHAILNFYPHGVEKGTTEPEFSVLLEPRSLFVQTDRLYKTYLHGIAEVTEDQLTVRRPVNYDPDSNNALLLRQTRISLTYRHVKNAIKNPFAKTLFKQ